MPKSKKENSLTRVNLQLISLAVEIELRLVALSSLPSVRLCAQELKRVAEKKSLTNFHMCWRSSKRETVEFVVS